MNLSYLKTIKSGVSSRARREGNPLKNVPALFALALAFLWADQANAQVTFTNLGSRGGFYGGMAYDPTTGDYYFRGGYYSPSTVDVYGSLSAYESGAASSTITLQSGQYGTYFAVQNGTLYNRSDDSSNGLATWSLSSGSQSSTGSISSMVGANFTNTFNWGGFSGMNFMQDSTGLYVLGYSATSSSWILDQMNSSLGVIHTSSFTNPSSGLGFGFMADGSLFLGSEYDVPEINYEFNPTTGTLASVAINLDTGLNNDYISNAVYVAQSDSLFLDDEGNLLISQGVGSELGLSAPEPAPWAFFLTGLAAWTVVRVLRTKASLSDETQVNHVI